MKKKRLEKKAAKAAQKTANSTPAKPRKPSVYRSDEVIDRVIAGLEKGIPLSVICREEGMPTVIAVGEWRANDQELDDRIARAKDTGSDVIAMEMLRIADTPHIGTEETTKEWGVEVRTFDMVAHRKLQIHTRAQLLSKWDRRYCDVVRNELSGAGGGPLKVETLEKTPEEKDEFFRRLAAAREAVAPKALDSNGD